MDVLDLTVMIMGGALPDSELLPGRGDGTLGFPQYVPLQMYNGSLIDLNGDGALDLVGPEVFQSGVQRTLNTGAK